MGLFLILILTFGHVGKASESPSPQEMASFTESLLKEAAREKTTFKALASSLRELPKRTLISQNQVEKVLKLLDNSKESKEIAAALFTSDALIQAAEASQMLTTPLERAKALETFQLIENYADNYRSNSDPKPVSSALKTLSFMAATSARVDLTASLLLQAKNYLRRIPESNTTPIQELEILFAEISSGTLQSPEDLTHFDERLLTSAKKLAPGASTIQEAASFWHQALKTAHHEELVDLAADSMRSELYETVEVLRRAIPQIKKQLLNQSGIIDRSFFGGTPEAQATLSYLEKLLEGTGLKLRRMTDPLSLERAWSARDQIKTLTLWALEASLSKSKTANEIASVIGTALSRLGLPSTDSRPFLSPEELHKIHQALRTQNGEAWVRAFINKEMAVVYAQSAILLGQAIAVPFTWGGSLAAMPTTLHAIVFGLEAVGKTTLIVNSALSISDRYVQQGVNGLINPSSALDALTITMLLPRVAPLAPWMHEASYFAVFGHAAFGAYQLAYAERIAETLRLQGYQSSAAEIRQKALGHLAEAFLLGLCEWSSHSDAFTSQTPFKSISDRLRYMVFPHEAFRDTFKSLAPTLGVPLAGMAAAVPAAGYVAYDYVIASESLMYFFAGTDFGYFAHNQAEKEYPELKEEETAVSFIGFDEADMLYTGAHAIDAHEVELRKYGKRYFIYDYDSPEDLLKKLSEHAKTHGPVKYLRIMTHGLPGRLYTHAVSLSGGGSADHAELAEREGWIDAEWLRRNNSLVQKTAETSMAPEARLVLFACLVGANLDSPLPGLEKTAGDDFLKALGETLLVKKGLIDSSIRFLMGIDTIYGSLMNWATREELLQSNDFKQHQPLLPVSLFKQEEKERYFTKARLDSITLDASEGDGPETSEMLQYSASRLVRMLTQLHKLGYHYGILLEGPWWSTPRYKHAQVSDRGVEITTH